MLLSVCIPTYNGGKYIEDCLKSVSEQTYNDFEIIICDDCSTDNTVNIIRKFQEKDKRIKLFENKKNLGLVGNWNRCIELANGEWIKYVFQDDFVSKNCLQMVLQADDKKSQMIVCEREYVFEEGIDSVIKELYDKSPKLYQFLGNNEVKYVSAKNLALLIRKYFPSNFIGEPTSIMFKKSVVNAVGFFNTQITQLCDIEFCLRVGVNSGFVYVPNKLVSFRVHDKSTSQKNNSDKYFSSVFGDRIRVLYLLLFDTLYVNFRKNCTRVELLKMKYSLFYVVYQADNYIEKGGKKNILLMEMKELKNQLPKIKRFRKYYLLYAGLKSLSSFVNPKSA
ncbi:MAG TPA: glycosyltransferase family 2 protein [Bacteroidia bacterium]|nr:glycosyltransferase family 2 protein [Bacteroidia bacterium]